MVTAEIRFSRVLKIEHAFRTGLALLQITFGVENEQKAAAGKVP